MYLQNVLKRLFAFVCLDAIFMCLFRCVAFPVIFENLCRGLLSCIHSTVTDQSWQTGPNESVLQLKNVFVVC